MPIFSLPIDKLNICDNILLNIGGKMLKKRLIALMVAGVITTATLSGCGNGNDSVKTNFTGALVEDGFIIIKQNDSQILHKGDYYRDTDGPNNGYQFDCGEDFYSNAESSVYFKHPKADRYDEKCEECFANEQ